MNQSREDSQTITPFPVLGTDLTDLLLHSFRMSTQSPFQHTRPRQPAPTGTGRRLDCISQPWYWMLSSPFQLASRIQNFPLEFSSYSVAFSVMSLFVFGVCVCGGDLEPSTSGPLVIKTGQLHFCSPGALSDWLYPIISRSFWKR